MIGRLQGVKILIADDMEVNALLIKTYLEDEGADVAVVTDGAQAVKEIRGRPYDFLFIDLNMPNLGGIEAVRQIRAFGDKKSLHIVGITGENSTEIVRRCRSAGMEDVLFKPFMAEDIVGICGKIRTAGHAAGPSAAAGEAPRPDAGVSGADRIFDYPLALNEFQNNAELLRGVIDKFIVRLESSAPGMERALRERNWGMLLTEAHTVKGAASNLRAYALENAARHFESALKQEDPPSIADAYARYAMECAQFKSYCASLKA